LVAGLKWSATIHCVARLSKYETVKAGHPQSGHYQEMVSGLRLARLAFAARVALGFAQIGRTLHVLALIGFAFAFHYREAQLDIPACIIHL
jgi:hypothetical protein